MGVSQMTREHMSLLVTLRIPFVVLVSKIDLVPPNVLEETLARINEVVRKGAGKTPFSIKSTEDVLHAAKHIKSDSIVPILLFSNVTSVNMDLLRLLLNVLPPRNDYQANVHDPVELLVDNTYSVTGHPTIVSGMLRRGIVSVGDTLSLGPYFDSSFKATKVKSIHNKFKDVKSAKAGHYICLSLKGITRAEIKKGMVLVADLPASRIATREFWAFVSIYHSPTTIRTGYQPFIHVDQVRQSCVILEIQKFVNGRPPAAGGGGGGGVGAITAAPSTVTTADSATATATAEGEGEGEGEGDSTQSCLRTGDKAHIRIRFLNKPEYVKPSMRLIFREGRVKAAGRVLSKPIVVVAS